MSSEYSSVLSAPVTDLKGIGEKTAKLFDSCGVRTVGELLCYYPRTYERYDSVVTVREFAEGKVCAVKCRLLRVPALVHASRYAILTAEATDGTDGFRATWFNQPYLKNTLYPGREYVLRGYVKLKGQSYVLEQPAIYSPEDYLSMAGSMLPRYPLVRGLKNNTVMKAVKEALRGASGLQEPLPESLRTRRGLIGRREAVSRIHFPPDEAEMAEARKRLVYDEFLSFLTGVRLMKAADEEDDTGIVMSERTQVDGLVSRLPYSLTGAQLRVFDEIMGDMASGRHMHRLVQGDVGSGKTILALLAMLTAAENGYQSVLMAPTQVLAAQHYETFRNTAEKYDLPLKPILLSGTLTAKEKRLAREAIINGEVNCIIGTNAVMQEKAEYRGLGLVITDEQHRFGVRQRELLAGKGARPHILVMSATPIPRTLAMILYGDLHISVLDEMPAGRKKIKNAVVGEDLRARSHRFIADEVKKGRQAYVICPMIEEGELEDAQNVTDYTSLLRKALPKGVRVDMLHGRMKPAEKDEVMERFAKHETDVLVSTTVVEVGVNVPNATVMMIENADRFGLAQLHQLRGRVGRGDEQSYCIFVNTSRSGEAAERLEILSKSNDGFEIADMDLKLRGPGDLTGVRQSGEMEFKIADIYADSELLKAASEDADLLLAGDPGLASEENRVLREMIMNGSGIDFDTI